MEGRTPPPAPERQKEDTLIPATEELKTRYPFPLLRLVDWSMSMEIGDRPQDAGELLAAILEEVAPSPDKVSGGPPSESE